MREYLEQERKRKAAEFRKKSQNEFENKVSTVGIDQFKARKKFEEKAKSLNEVNKVNEDDFNKNIDEYKNTFLRKYGYIN